MAHLCVTQNLALGICGGLVPDIQVCGTRGREDLVNATITWNAEEEETPCMVLGLELMSDDNRNILGHNRNSSLRCWFM